MSDSNATPAPIDAKWQSKAIKFLAKAAGPTLAANEIRGFFVVKANRKAMSLSPGSQAAELVDQLQLAGWERYAALVYTDDTIYAMRCSRFGSARSPVVTITASELGADQLAIDASLHQTKWGSLGRAALTFADGSELPLRSQSMAQYQTSAVVVAAALAPIIILTTRNHS